MRISLQAIAHRLIDRRRYSKSPSRYWEARHTRHGSGLEGVGCICLSEEENRADYEAKWARIQVLLKDRLSGQLALDAGCGNGFFTARMRDLGLRVEGVDFSEAAIASARERLGDDTELYVSSLDGFAPDHRYSIVICIDVLFHIVDDHVWRETVRNLARLSNQKLIIQDHLVDEALASHANTGAVHCRWRSLQMYKDVLPQWHLVSHEVYQLPLEDVTKDLLRFEPEPVDEA